MSEHRYANTDAARMLAAALHSASQERGLSLREIGRRLGYKQPVVLSHMASGRVPIPTDRALDIAKEAGISPSVFLKAVLHQQHPSVTWELITEGSGPILKELENAANMRLENLSAEHRRVLREVCSDSNPSERWISIREIALLKLIREALPTLQINGLSADDISTLRTCFEFLKDAGDE